MNFNEEIYKKMTGNISLLCNIIKPNNSSRSMKADLSKIEKIINVKIPETLKNNAPEDFYDIYTDFKSEYEKFKDFILYEKLIGKNIVALGGGFSSGKSSFLNSLMGRNVLPADIDPSTSVPTYIVKSDKHQVTGINVFDTMVEMQPRDIRKISHGFGEIEDDNGNVISEAVTLGHVLESMFFSTPLHTYDNIAFLDTPGYSKPDSEKYSAKTDEKIARRQLNSSNYILWFVQADVGTITEEDIKFIKTLRPGIPKLIVVNKADKKNVRELKEIIEKIKVSLEIKGIRYVDVLAFTSRPEQVENEELSLYISRDTEKIKKQIEKWNTGIYEANFAINFKKLFVKCKDFYFDEIEERGQSLARLNTSITKLIAEDIDPDIVAPLQTLVKDAQRDIGELKQLNADLKSLQDEFFTEIKFIADIVGISMPEPSEIDLLREKVNDPLKELEEYKKSLGVKTNNSLVHIMQTAFENIEPVMNTAAGGAEYKNELIMLLKNSFEGTESVMGKRVRRQRV